MIALRCKMSRQPTQSSSVKDRAAFTGEGIALAALKLIDEQGIDAFSTRTLGARIGLQAMSLYHYFVNREALLDAVVDCMVAEVSLPNPNRVDWRPGLQQLAYRYRVMGHRHRRAIPLLVERCPASPRMHRFLDTLSGLLLKAGLDPINAARWLLIQRDYVLGSLMADFSTDLLATEKNRQASISGMAGNLARRNLVFGRREREHVFRKGFDALLDAIEHEQGKRRRCKPE